LGDLLLLVGIEVAEEAFAIFGSSLGQVVDEGFDLLPRGIPECSGSAVIGGIGFDRIGVEPMLTNQQAESVAEPRWAIGGLIIAKIAGAICIGKIVVGRSGCPTKLFDRTQSNAIRFAKGAINSTSLSNPHFGAPKKWGNVGRISIAITHKAF
jgi:hypothetical protein